MSRIVFERKLPAEARTDEDDWAGLSEAKIRRKIQNRLNQRSYRRRRAAEREARKASATCRAGRSILLAPKGPIPGENGHHAAASQGRGAEGSDSHARLPNTSASLVVLPVRPSSLVQPNSIHSAAAPECARLFMDGEVRRVHHYAASVLWPSFGACILGTSTNEMLSTAFFRLSMTDPLLLNSFIWTGAMELSLHGSSARNNAVMLQCQNRAIQAIRSHIDRAEVQVPDSVIFAVMTLTIRDTNPRLALQEDAEDGYIFGAFDPPLRSLGWLEYLSHFRWTQSHIDAVTRLVASRGGLENITTPGIAEQLQSTDILQASLDVSRPNFALCRLFRYMLENKVYAMRPSDEGERQRIVDVFPLGRGPEDDLEFKSLLLDMHMYCRLLETVVDQPSADKDSSPSSSSSSSSSSSPSPSPSPSTSCPSASSWETNVYRNLIQFRLLCLPRHQVDNEDVDVEADDDADADDGADNKLDEDEDNDAPRRDDEYLCRLAALIFSYGVIYPLSRRRPLSMLTKQLRCALEGFSCLPTTTSNSSTSNSSHGRIRSRRRHRPGHSPTSSDPPLSEFLLWVLMMGGLAAWSTPEESFFVTSLSSMIKGGGGGLQIETFDALVQIMRKFLWFGPACDKGARQIWEKCVALTKTTTTITTTITVTTFDGGDDDDENEKGEGTEQPVLDP